MQLWVIGLISGLQSREAQFDSEKLLYHCGGIGIHAGPNPKNRNLMMDENWLQLVGYTYMVIGSSPIGGTKDTNEELKKECRQ